MSRVVLASLLSVLPSTLLFAHEGHGHTEAGQGNSLWHYITEPQHAWVFAALVVAAAVLALVRWSAGNTAARAEDIS